MLTPGVADGTTAIYTGTLAVRWIATATADEFLRVEGRNTLSASAGKGVSLEPSTGFTFDTALTPLPR